MTLTVTDDDGAQDTTAQVVPVRGPNLAPTAAFTFTVNGPTVDFTDQSTDPDFGDNVTEWEWDFGDIFTDTAQNPSHTYAAGGTYNVTLTVTDSYGASDTTSKDVMVSSGNQPPTAGFIYSAITLTAIFTDTSSDPDGSISAWSWNFDDGATSTLKDPVHAYAVPGTYDVVLTVTDDDGVTDTLGQQITVSGGGATEMHIEELSTDSVNDIDNVGTWIALVTIEVRDDAGDLVPNATVTGRWSKGFYTNSTCTTDANGQCTVEQHGIKSKTRRVTFTVENVTHPTMTYNASSNVVSSIRVNRP